MFAKHSSVLFIVMIAFTCDHQAWAHSGRTDSSGGHNSASGYHYHRGGYTTPPRVTYRLPTNYRFATPSRTRRKTTPKPKTKPRVTYRSSVKTSTYTNALYIEIDTSKELTDDDCRFDLFEVSKKSEVEENQKLRFFVVEGYESFKNLRDSVANVQSNLANLIGKSELSNVDAKLYLNGMSLSKTSWAHCESTSDKYGVWIRDVDSSEFNSRTLYGLKHPFRIWTDNSGSFRIEAAYLSGSADDVALLKRNGRKIFVPKTRLSDEDQAYVKAIR